MQEHAHQLEADLRRERAERQALETELAQLRANLSAKRDKQSVKFGPRSWLSRRPAKRPTLDAIAEEGSVASQLSFPKDLETLGRVSGSFRSILGPHELDDPDRRVASGDALLSPKQGTLGTTSHACSFRSVFFAICAVVALALVAVSVALLRPRGHARTAQLSIDGHILQAFERRLDVAVQATLPGAVRYVVIPDDAASAADVEPTGADVFWVGQGRRHSSWGEVRSSCAVLCQARFTASGLLHHHGMLVVVGLLAVS